MIASLPMYDTSATRAANDRLWALIREQLVRGPDRLDRESDPHAVWLRPDLLLSQTCSLPYRTELKGKVKLVGTPDYGIEGCPPGYYRSCIVVHKDDPRQHLSEFAGATLARNDIRSQSGWAAIEQELLDRGLPFSFANSAVDTGAHIASAQTVAKGEADIASLDAVTWALLERDTTVTDNLRVLTLTKPTPGLPLITSMTEDATAIFNAVSTAIAMLSPGDKNLLLLKGLVEIPPDNYLFGYSIPA